MCQFVNHLLKNFMADISKHSYILKIKFGFSDGDTRIINLDNPKTNLQATQIYEVSQYIKENNLLLGDKYGADSAGILTADIVESNKTTLDL